MVNANELAKTAGITLPDEITDEQGNILEMDYTKFKRGLEIVKDVRGSIFKLSKDLHEFFTEGYHLYFGFTMEEASVKLFGMSLRSAQRFQLVYEKLGAKYEEFEYLGISKLKEIAQIPEEERKELLEEGVLKLADGTEITVEEINATSTKTLRDKLRAETLARKRATKELEEAEKEHKAEVKSLKKEITERDNILDMEKADYGFYRKLSKLQETRSVLEEVDATLTTSFIRLTQIELNELNEQCEADIKGILISTAEKIINASRYYQIDLGDYMAQLEGVAAQ